jgi:hypothetical protein
MSATEVDEILRDPGISRWLRIALRTALTRDPVDAAADAAKLVEVLDRRLCKVLREELLSEPVRFTAEAESNAA